MHGKSMRPAARIEKVMDALHGKLTLRQRMLVLRFSVLTLEEYQQIIVGG